MGLDLFIVGGNWISEANLIQGDLQKPESWCQPDTVHHFHSNQTGRNQDLHTANPNSAIRNDVVSTLQSNFLLF